MSMTEVRVRRGGPEAVRGEMLLVPVAEGQLSAALRRLDRRVRGPLARRARAARFAGKAEETLVRVAAVVQEIFHARALVNEPASVATPRFLAERGAALAREIRGLEAEAWAPKRIAREGLTGLLAVARGSREEPRFIRLRWAGPGARRRVILVGKGITFDSGGLSLKPPKSMETMKYDMAGGAAVIGAVAATARLGLPVDVTAFVPATENLPGGQAQKPGDVIRFLEEFVDGVPWAHLDIAGPAFTEKDLLHAPRGGTGFGVRLLVRYLSDLG